MTINQSEKVVIFLTTSQEIWWDKTQLWMIHGERTYLKTQQYDAELLRGFVNENYLWAVILGTGIAGSFTIKLNKKSG